MHTMKTCKSHSQGKFNMNDVQMLNSLSQFLNCNVQFAIKIEYANWIQNRRRVNQRLIGPKPFDTHIHQFRKVLSKKEQVYKNETDKSLSRRDTCTI